MISLQLHISKANYSLSLILPNCPRLEREVSWHAACSGEVTECCVGVLALLKCLITHWSGERADGDCGEEEEEPKLNFTHAQGHALPQWLC